MAPHHLHQFLLKQLYQAQVSGQNQPRDTYKKKKSMTKNSCQLPQQLLAMTLRGVASLCELNSMSGSTKAHVLP